MKRTEQTIQQLEEAETVDRKVVNCLVRSKAVGVGSYRLLQEKS